MHSAAADQRVPNGATSLGPGVDHDWRGIVFKSVALFAVAFAVYFLTRSPGLDEWDSVQFAMGVQHFDMWQHHPHPPGYPLFIFFGWICQQLFNCGPIFSLHLASALGGAAFVALWFLIIRAQFSERLAWWVAITLAVLPGVWLTATKILTDMPAAAFLSAELLAAIYYRRSRNLPTLVIVGLFGAVAVGFRPQLILIALVILATALKNNGANRWLAGISVFLLANFAWLVPTSYLQAQADPSVPAWRAYIQLLYSQWTWRLNNPHAFIGAGNWSLKYLGTRFVFHILGWFGLGFGFLKSWPILITGAVIAAIGLVIYLRAGAATDRSFWRFHAPWALVLIAIVFICLPASARYYMMIFPLLLIALLRGFLLLSRPWNRLAIILPLFLLFVVTPLALANHREQPPPFRLVEYLDHVYPENVRSRVALVLKPSRRHAQWYSPQYQIPDPIPSPDVLREVTKNAAAIYVDDLSIPLPEEWLKIPVTVFKRPLVLHSKHYSVPLYLIVRKDHP